MISRGWLRSAAEILQGQEINAIHIMEMYPTIVRYQCYASMTPVSHSLQVWSKQASTIGGQAVLLRRVIQLRPAISPISTMRTSTVPKFLDRIGELLNSLNSTMGGVGILSLMEKWVGTLMIRVNGFGWISTINPMELVGRISSVNELNLRQILSRYPVGEDLCACPP